MRLLEFFAIGSHVSMIPNGCNPGHQAASHTDFAPDAILSEILMWHADLNVSVRLQGDTGN